MRRKTKKILIIVALSLVFFGWPMFGYTMFYRANVETEIYHKKVPLHDTSRIAVDSQGNVYYWLEKISLVQVYEQKGNYKFGFSFHRAASGGSEFYLDESDDVHILTYHDGEYVFSGNKLISHLQITDDYRNEMFRKLNTGDRNKYTTNNGLIYKLNRFNKSIKIYDAVNKQIVTTFVPDAPIWPWSMYVYFAIASIGGLIIIYIIFYKEIKEKLADFFDLYKR